MSTAASSESYEIQGKNVRLPAVVRDASSGSVMYLVDRAAAQALVPDAFETVGCMLEDLQQGTFLKPDHPQPEAIETLLASCGTTVVRYADWLASDASEVAAGKASGRPRVKFTTAEEVWNALNR